MRAIDDVRVRVGSRVVRIDAATALCSGEGRGVMRRGLRTWLHFRCTFTTFGATGPGRVSHGCVRLRNEDIVRLSRLMPVGTPVTIR
jgi:hypothetical protein